MSFTDEELNNFKNFHSGSPQPPHLLLKIKALIARLEAAEKLVRVLGSDPLSGEVGKAYEAWLQSKRSDGRGNE